MARVRELVGQVTADLGQKSRDSSPVSSSETLERNIRVNTYHGIVSVMAVNLAAPFIGIFAVKSGASDFQVGLLSSGPALVSLLSMLPGGSLMDRLRRKRDALALLILLNRLFYLFIATIPFFSPDRRAWLLVFAVALMNMPASIANIGWQAFISKVIPASRRAEAFATRNRLMNLAGTLVVVITGRVIDIVGFPLGYQLVFAGAFLMSLAEAWVLRQIDEPAPEAEVAGDGSGARPSLWTALRGLGDNPRFVRYTLASIVFYLVWQTPWPLFTLYQVKVLGANNMWVSLLSLTNTGGTLLGYGFWARKCNELGSLRTLFLSSLGIFIVPVAYAVSKSLLTVAMFNLLTGAIFSGVNLALFNHLLEVTPEGNKATYIALYTTAVNCSAILAPMLGVSLLRMLDFFWAFMVCAGLRLSGSFMFLIVERLERRASRKDSLGKVAGITP